MHVSTTVRCMPNNLAIMLRVVYSLRLFIKHHGWVQSANL